MSYQYLTQWDSPNFTPAIQTRNTWGVDRQIKEIAIHWWNAPNAGATFEGVVGGFLRPGGLSAHYVATGNGRRVACLVSPTDNSWATGRGNPVTISIECDPAQSDADFDTIAELIADIRSVYGDLPLVPHFKYVATRCTPYDLARLDREARNKFSHATDWGKGGSITPPAPKVTLAQIEAAYREVLEREADGGGIKTYLASGFDIERIKNELRNSNEYAELKVRKAQASQAALDAAKKQAEEQARLDLERAESDRASAIADAKAQADAELAKSDAQSWFLKLITAIFTVITNFIKGIK